VALSIELQPDPAVDQPLALQAVAYPGFLEQFDAPVLEHPGPDTVLNVVTAVVFEHDKTNAVPVQ
jgi:hypothetical protein